MTKKLSRRPDPPINEKTVALFLAEYPWLASSRHARDRLAYKLVEFLANELALARIKAGSEGETQKWTAKVQR